MILTTTPYTTILPLTARDLRDHAEAFVAIAADVPGEYWTSEHFLKEMPRKWDLSFALWRHGEPIAYAVVSEREPEHAHLHHFMLATAYRGRHLGSRFLWFVKRHVSKRGYQRLTVKVAVVNVVALRFYRMRGFAILANDGRYLTLEHRLT